MPLTWLSYSIDYMLFGDWFGGFHLHSILVHAANSCLVFLLLLSAFSGAGRASAAVPCLLASIFWAVHPLRCESVVFLASRKDVLSFFWELLALICWVSGTRRNVAGRGAMLHTALAIVLFAVAAMCKPSVMTFPLLCLLIDAFIFREVRVLRYIAPVACMVFLGAFAAWQQKAGGATFDPFNQPLYGRVLGAVAAFGIYLRNTVWPQWLAPQCVKTWPALPRFFWPGLAITGAAAWWLVSRALRYWDERNETYEAHQFRPARLRLRGARMVRGRHCPDARHSVFRLPFVRGQVHLHSRRGALDPARSLGFKPFRPPPASLLRRPFGRMRRARARHMASDWLLEGR